MFIKQSPDTIQKLAILTRGARYDVSCASSGVERKPEAGKLGYTLPGGICHSWSSDGRCVSLLKTLQTNCCTNNCAYCINRCKNNVERTVVKPEELANITYQFYRRNYIEGLFLTSGIMGNPNRTMELMLDTIKTLRTRYRFNGYIHAKILPGAEENAIEEAIFWADRVSINIELPTTPSLQLLAPQKNFKQIIYTMKRINAIREKLLSQRQKQGYYAMSGQSTQIIIGATPETDWQILKLTEYLYKNIGLKRVYYSAYVPINQEPYLPMFSNPPLLREHRLYQADWLLRFYGFSLNELLSEINPKLDEHFDPKVSWALRNLNFFPVEICTADLHQLLRVPGIGPISAQRILHSRKSNIMDLEALKRLGVVVKRARYFITIKGRYYGKVNLDDPYMLSERLSGLNKKKVAEERDLFSHELQSA
ncbi:MAG TPA: putative DNA modification/repair radical SAM protein [Candidatus Hydrogenedens sp.]|nr:putative DNA modification/repair radical SAM protein [Candidatus Hydrogenedens sp.]